MTTQKNIISDLNTYTRVPLKVLNDLIEKEELCIGSAIHDALMNKEEVLVLNIGLGTLSIELSSMQCKFIPSKDFKAIIKKCISEKVDPLLLQIEQDIITKLVAICEESL